MKLEWTEPALSDLESILDYNSYSYTRCSGFKSENIQAMGCYII